MGPASRSAGIDDAGFQARRVRVALMT